MSVACHQFSPRNHGAQYFHYCDPRKNLKGGGGCGTRRRRPTGTRPSTAPDNLENLNHDISLITVKIRYLIRARHLEIARLSLTRNGEVQNRLGDIRTGALLRSDSRLSDAMSDFGDAGSAYNDCFRAQSRHRVCLMSADFIVFYFNCRQLGPLLCP